MILHNLKKCNVILLHSLRQEFLYQWANESNKQWLCYCVCMSTPEKKYCDRLVHAQYDNVKACLVILHCDIMDWKQIQMKACNMTCPVILTLIHNHIHIYTSIYMYIYTTIFPLLQQSIWIWTFGNITEPHYILVSPCTLSNFLLPE